MAEEEQEGKINFQPFKVYQPQNKKEQINQNLLFLNLRRDQDWEEIKKLRKELRKIEKIEKIQEKKRREKEEKKLKEKEEK